MAIWFSFATDEITHGSRDVLTYGSSELPGTAEKEKGQQ